MILNLAVDISNQAEVMKANETHNKDLMVKQKEFEDNLTKVKVCIYYVYINLCNYRICTIDDQVNTSVVLYRMSW